MTPTITGHTTATGNGSGSVTINPATNRVGTAIATGNWLVMVVTSASSDTGDTRYPQVTGWTQIRAFTQVGAGTMCYGIWARLRKSNETTYTFNMTAGTDGSHTRLIWGTGGQDPSNWIIGTIENRASNATSTTAVAPSITTAIPDTLALLIAAERTLAAETDGQVTCSNFTKDWFENDIDQSLLVATKNISSVGSTGSSTVTYPNTHAENGIAGILGIQPVTIPFTWGGAM